MSSSDGPPALPNPTTIGGPGGPPALAQPGGSYAFVTPFGGRSPLAGIGDAPADVPLVLVKGDDGILRPRPLPEPEPDSGWPDADLIRVGTSPPTDAAPPGVVHLDASTGRIFRNGARA